MACAELQMLLHNFAVGLSSVNVTILSRTF